MKSWRKHRFKYDYFLPNFAITTYFVKNQEIDLEMSFQSAELCYVHLQKTKKNKKLINKNKQKLIQHDWLYATFSIFLLFYVRIVEANWNWGLTLHEKCPYYFLGKYGPEKLRIRTLFTQCNVTLCGMKLKLLSVLAFVKWSLLVILPT